MNKVEGWPTKQEEVWFQAGVNAENKRMLKVLEDLLKTLDNKAMHTDYGLAYTLRELIRGEHK